MKIILIYIEKKDLNVKHTDDKFGIYYDLFS